MNIHFTGIGGIGMSALARYFLAKGDSVSGSDSSISPLTNELQNEGVEWIDAHMPIPAETDLHIFTEAIPKDDVQMESAQHLQVISRSYFEQIGELSKQYKTIAICGTHGKSTTTAMTGIALSATDIDPLVIVGTKVREFGGKNIHIPNTPSPLAPLPEGEGNSELETPNSRLFIVEACEYRGSFLYIQPFGVVLTNCEHDHIDYYKTEESYIETFKNFVAKIPKDGFLVANFDDANVVEVAKSAQCTVIPVKLSEIKNPLTPKVPGWHNQLNAELSLAVCKEVLRTQNLELETQKDENSQFSALSSQLSQYAGTWRRFDILGEKNGVTVIDDYAHHPSEIRATLKALKEYAKNKNLVVVFQPHQYSRTHKLFDDFVKSFVEELHFDSGLSTIDYRLFITDIYEARDSEEDKKTVSAEMLADAIAKQGISAVYSGNYEQTLEKIKMVLHSGDVLITMGAGPVNQVAEMFLQ